MSDREKLKKRAESVAPEDWLKLEASTILALLSELEQAERERDDLMGVTGAQKFGQGWTLPFFNADGSETRMTPQQWVEKRKESAAALRTLREAAQKLLNCDHLSENKSEVNALAAALAAEGGK